jgi:hypothetical protein
MPDRKNLKEERLFFGQLNPLLLGSPLISQKHNGRKACQRKTSFFMAGRK